MRKMPPCRKLPGRSATHQMAPETGDPHQQRIGHPALHSAGAKARERAGITEDHVEEQGGKRHQPERRGKYLKGEVVIEKERSAANPPAAKVRRANTA